MSVCDECETATFDCTTESAPPGSRPGPRRVAEVLARSHRCRTWRSCPSFSNRRARDSERSARGSLGGIPTIRLPSVHLLAHFLHLTKNPQSVGAENFFDVRRAIAAIE